jgi:hypothetical protein
MCLSLALLSSISIVPSFRPSFTLRRPHLQTILATSGPRRWLARKTWRALEQKSPEVILDSGDGVRLGAWPASARHDHGHPRLGDVLDDLPRDRAFHRSEVVGLR